MTHTASPPGGVDRRIMWRAVAAAAASRPHPNPRVGAVVVDGDGTVIAEAHHEGPGRPHAETVALAAAGGAAAGATLYTTLEPCDHQGRTGPCTAAIIAAGVSRVIVGAVDPDPRVQGAGVARLRAAGIEVVAGSDEGLVESTDPAYFHHRRTGRPLVTWKTAMTLDGQAAAADGTSQWITGEAARADSHRLRAASDAVVVGAGTARTDDPRLTVRGEDFDGPQPRPVIVAGRGELPAGLALWTRRPLVYAPQARNLPSGELVVAPGPDGVDLGAMIQDLGERGMLAVLVEGGPTLAAGLWRCGLVDRAVIYAGAVFGGGTGVPILAGTFATLPDARKAEVHSVDMAGGDVRIEVRL